MQETDEPALVETPFLKTLILNTEKRQDSLLVGVDLI